MASNESTAAREALTRKFVRCHRVYNPPIEWVRDGGWCEWAVADDGTAWERWGFGEWEEIDPLPPRTDPAPSCAGTAPPSDGPPVGKGQGRSDAPSPQAGAEKDERYWWLNPKTGECSRHWEDVGSDGIPVVPKSRLDQAEREREEWRALALAWQNAAQRAGEELSESGPAGYYAMTAARWLAWMRERGLEVREERRRGEQYRDALTSELTTLRTQLAEAKQEREEYKAACGDDEPPVAEVLARYREAVKTGLANFRADCEAGKIEPVTGRRTNAPQSPGSGEDRRRWLVSRHIETGDLGVIELHAAASRERTEREWDRMCRYSTDHVRVVALSELERVLEELRLARLCSTYETDVAGNAIADMERVERDRKKVTRAWRLAMDKATWYERECEKLRTQLADAEANAERENAIGEKFRQERDAANACYNDLTDEIIALTKQLVAMARDRDNWKANAERENAEYERMRKLRDGLQEERDATTKRIEEGQVILLDSDGDPWREGEPDGWELNRFGPFTRGRFVPDVANDQEGAQ